MKTNIVSSNVKPEKQSGISPFKLQFDKKMLFKLVKGLKSGRVPSIKVSSRFLFASKTKSE